MTKIETVEMMLELVIHGKVPDMADSDGKVQS